MDFWTASFKLLKLDFPLGKPLWPASCRRHTTHLQPRGAQDGPLKLCVKSVNNNSKTKQKDKKQKLGTVPWKELDIGIKGITTKPQDDTFHKQNLWCHCINFRISRHFKWKNPCQKRYGITSSLCQRSCDGLVHEWWTLFSFQDMEAWMWDHFRQCLCKCYGEYQSQYFVTMVRSVWNTEIPKLG